MGGKNTLLSFILPFIGILFILELSKWLVRIFRMREKGGALLQVSMASYLIYLLHTTFEGFVKAIVQRLPVVDHGLWYVFIPEVVVVISCGVIVPMWLSCVFKRYRLTRWMFGL